MNPACKIDLAGRECQDWMTEVTDHCSSLLPDAEEAALWDRWWPDEPPSPYKSVVNYMSAFDCHKLRREVARLVEESESSSSTCESTAYRVFRYILLALVMGVVLVLMMCVMWILVNTFRHKKPRQCTCTPYRPARGKRDVESAQCQKSSSEAATLRNPVRPASSRKSSDSQTPCGPCRTDSRTLYNRDNISVCTEAGTSYYRPECTNTTTIRWNDDITMIE